MVSQILLPLLFIFLYDVEEVWSSWVAQLVGCTTLDFGSGQTFKVMRLNPVLDSVLHEGSS